MDFPPPTPPSPPLDAQEAPEAKEPILAWWGIIPTIVYLVVQVIYGWPQAKIRASEPDYVISYFMGGLLAGLVISFLIAWIAYRLFDRSQYVGTIAFTAAMALCCWATIRPAHPHQTSDKQTVPQPVGPSATRAFPIVGIAVGSPPGWQELPPDRSTIVTRWLSPDSRAGDVRAMILVELKKPISGGASAAAQDLAKDWGGRVTNEHDSLDGELAVRIQADAPTSGLRPVEGLLSIHDGHLFLIMGGVTPGHSCHDQIEFIRQTWKWTSAESPILHLQFRDQPLVALGGKVSFNFPTIMATSDGDPPDQSIGLELYNYKRDASDLTALVQTIDLPSGDTFDAAKERLGKGTQERFKLPEPFVWHDIKSAHQAAITQPVRGPAEDGVNWVIWAMVALDEKRMVLINFSIYAPDPDDRSTYAQTAQKIAESVSPTPADKTP